MLYRKHLVQMQWKHRHRQNQRNLRLDLARSHKVVRHLLSGNQPLVSLRHLDNRQRSDRPPPRHRLDKRPSVNLSRRLLGQVRHLEETLPAPLASLQRLDLPPRRQHFHRQPLVVGSVLSRTLGQQSSVSQLSILLLSLQLPPPFRHHLWRIPCLFRCRLLKSLWRLSPIAVQA